MPLDKAAHLCKLATALSKAKAKAKQKMTRAPGKVLNQPDDSQAVDESTSPSHFSEHKGHHTDLPRGMSGLLSAEEEEDLKHMLSHDFAALSAEEYQAEIQPMFDETLTFMNRQDALDRLG